jgi:NAD(P)-dependent dehydrogenase (short-subunit alcohol dehydrogenase family)
MGQGCGQRAEGECEYLLTSLMLRSFAKVDEWSTRNAPMFTREMREPTPGRARCGVLQEGSEYRSASCRCWSTMPLSRNTLEDITGEHFDRTLRINPYGSLQLARAAPRKSGGSGAGMDTTESGRSVRRKDPGLRPVQQSGRPAQPEEISPADAFLAPPGCASFITGALLPVLGRPTP